MEKVYTRCEKSKVALILYTPINRHTKDKIHLYGLKCLETNRGFS